jgi:hypothetical protein
VQSGVQQSVRRGHVSAYRTQIRLTIGVRHRATKMITPARPTTRSHHPRTRIQRAVVSRNPGSRVRFAPDTAVK